MARAVPAVGSHDSSRWAPVQGPLCCWAGSLVDVCVLPMHLGWHTSRGTQAMCRQVLSMGDLVLAPTGLSLYR